MILNNKDITIKLKQECHVTLSLYIERRMVRTDISDPERNDRVNGKERF